MTLVQGIAMILVCFFLMCAMPHTLFTLAMQTLTLVAMITLLHGVAANCSSVGATLTVVGAA